MGAASQRGAPAGPCGAEQGRGPGPARPAPVRPRLGAGCRAAARGGGRPRRRVTGGAGAGGYAEGARARRGGTHHCGGRGLRTSPPRPAGPAPRRAPTATLRACPQRLSYPVCLSVRPVRGAARARRRPGCGSCRRCQDAVTMGTERRGARRSRIYRQRPPQPLPPRRRGSPAPPGARTAAGLTLPAAALGAGCSSGGATELGGV